MYTFYTGKLSTNIQLKKSASVIYTCVYVYMHACVREAYRRTFDQSPVDEQHHDHALGVVVGVRHKSMQGHLELLVASFHLHIEKTLC
jgi:hypothetical protein